MKLPKFIRAIFARQPDLPVHRPRFADDDLWQGPSYEYGVTWGPEQPAYVRNFRKTPEQRSEQAKLGHVRKRAREAAKRENASG